MKFKLIALALLLSGLNAFSQTQNNISVYWATVKADMFTVDKYSDSGYDLRGGSTKFGINYDRQLSKHWSLETGLQYTYVPMILISYYPPAPHQTPTSYKFITVPVLGKITFWDVLFLDGGAVINVQTNSPGSGENDKQTGIGFELGAGMQCNFHHLRIFINPYLQSNAMIPFVSAGENQTHYILLNNGWKFGLGYNF